MSAIHSSVCRSPFDGIADTYDNVFTDSSIGRAQRALVWQSFQKAFRPGDRVLDLGCGTGVDACFLAERGIRALAVDCSSEMIRVAKQRVASRGMRGRIELKMIAIERLRQLEDQAPFDGLVSNFGALNCVQDLRSLAANIAALLRPGATALLCFLGPNCLWEIIWYMAQGNPRKAFRRWRKAGTIARLSDGSGVQIQYPGVRSLRRIFEPQFRLKSWKGIGVTIPPSYVESAAGRFPRTMQFASQADRMLGAWPGVRGLADHVLMEFVRN